ncbi:MAG: hypothetical protein ABFS22_01830 [Pseudomonadota bacterium]
MSDSQRVEQPPPGQPEKPATGFRIADWAVEPALSRITRDGKPVKLEPKVMAVLVYLAERPGQLVTREDPAERQHFLAGLRQAGLFQSD